MGSDGNLKRITMHWIYKGNSDFNIPENAFGFVYLIECILPEEELTRLNIIKTKYIGRKYLTAAKTTSKKVLLKSGAKVTKKKKSRVESGWRDYIGSCKPLIEQIEKLGKDKFRFEILCFCSTKGQTNFCEVFAQFRAGVLIDDSYFNEAIGSGQFRGIRLDSEFIKMLKEIQL